MRNSPGSALGLQSASRPLGPSDDPRFGTLPSRILLKFVCVCGGLGLSDATTGVEKGQGRPQASIDISRNFH